MTRPLRLAILAVLLLVIPTACVGAGGEDDRPLVIASTSVWAEVIEALDPSDALRVEVLLPPGADPHEYQASAAQAADLRRADLVVVNGLGLEEGLLDAIEAAEDDGVLVIHAAEYADPLPFDGHEEHDEHAEEEHEEHDEEEHADEEHDEHDHEGGLDPHVWLDPMRIGIVALALGDLLDEQFDGLGAADAAVEYAAAMDALAEEMAELLAPVEDRRLVSNHDAFGYFADRFGFEVVGVVIPGGSTDADPNSRDLAALTERIIEESIPAIFVDEAVSSTVAEALAAEAEGVVVVEMVTGGPNGEAPTDSIEGFLIENATRIVDALGNG
jgi:zinc/manganese transport system substrate-binding protein